MRVTRLKLANLRSIEVAEFRFQPGFNLIVGINGVGKTSVLEALGVCLSAIVRHTNRLRARSESFSDRDIRKGARALTAECGVQLGNHEYSYLIHKSRSSGEGQSSKAGMPREQSVDTPDRAEFVGEVPMPQPAPHDGGHPIGVLFSTRRAAEPGGRPSKGSAAGGLAAACADALLPRELRLPDFAHWMRAQEALNKENLRLHPALEAFEAAVQRFLPGYQNVRTDGEAQPTLLIDHGERITLRENELSDVERAGLLQALEWADNWMALNWKADEGLTESEIRNSHAKAKSSAIIDGVARFMPGCKNLRPSRGGYLIDRSPITIDVAQLSDGERGTLALLLDLTRRLAQANPEMNDPAAEAEAVVLIDEIDLHLHPRWQRQIISNLTATFPRCQFIATTHSPQIIGEVEHDRIQIIAGDRVYSPSHSFGVDSSRILEEIMGADSRTKEVRELLSQVTEETSEHRFDRARELLSALTELLVEDDPDVIRVRTLLDFMEREE